MSARAVLPCVPACPRSIGLWWSYYQAAVHKMMPHMIVEQIIKLQNNFHDWQKISK
jgi:hypothetical protein